MTTEEEKGLKVAQNFVYFLIIMIDIGVRDKVSFEVWVECVVVDEHRGGNRICVRPKFLGIGIFGKKALTPLRAWLQVYGHPNLVFED